MTPYSPQPGTVAFRVLSHFDTLGTDAELTTADLAEALGIDSGGMIAYLATAVRHGVIKLRKRPGTRISLWSVGGGELPSTQESDEEVDKPLVTVEEILAGKLPPNSVFGLAAEIGAAPQSEPPPIDRAKSLPPASPGLNWKPAKNPAPREEPAPIAPPAPIPRKAPAVPLPVGAAPVTAEPVEQRKASSPAPMFQPIGFRVAIWSDGTLQLQRDAADLALLRPEETRQLLHYLERMAEIEP